jgi:pilus assembly protein FimV
MRSLARWAVLSLLVAPAGAKAVSLGEIDVRSALNQPLAAEIALTATAEELQSLTISLASAETFARYGLDRPAFLTSLEFRIGANPAGNRAVFVTSRQSIAEPFVELLIEASSRSGRFLRQYTLFLDPPTLLPATAVPQPIEPAQTRQPEPSAAGGEIRRPTPAQEPEPAAPPSIEPREPAAETSPQPSRTPPATTAVPPASLPGTYGEVVRGETLWGISSTLRPSGVTMNQMMVAIYEANPQAFNSNMNILRRGAILRIPELSEIRAVDTRAATAEVQSHEDTWRGRAAQPEPRLVLVPPSDEVVPTVRDTRGADSAAEDEIAESFDETPPPAEVEPSERLVDIQDSELATLQDRLGGEPDAAAPPAPGADPGVELEAEAVFADEPPIAVEELPAEPVAAEPTPVVAPPTPAPTAEPSLLETILGFLATPIVWIAAGGAVVVVGVLLFLRRRSRAEPEDVTGKWEALQAELDDDVAREATARLRRKAGDEDFVVHEQPAEPEPEEAPAAPAPVAKKARAPAPAAPAPREPELADQTLSSQTVINLDQADAIAEADFHMAYGLYDQAAELVSKAVNEQPKRRDLKLKLLEVFFVWGNKESFLKTAKGLREQMGARPDQDWDKVVIMGKQICPDEPLFAAATAVAMEVDVDLEAGEAPALDLSFDADEGGGAGIDLDFGAAAGDLTIAQSGTRAAAKPATAKAAPAQKPAARRDLTVDLDIGARTQAGLEAALLELDEKASKTTPDVEDALAATQESPTGETPRSGFDDWSAVTMESPTVESEGPAATAEQPSRHRAATMGTPTVESTGLRDRKGTDSSGEFTAELNLDDLGLDLDDVKDLPQGLGELPSADDADSDTREQPQIGIESDLLSATGVTQVLHEDDAEFEHSKTAILGDNDATMLAPGFEGDGTVRTEVLQRPIESLTARKARSESDLDLNLDDFSAALHGGDTVEQPHASTFETGIFQSGATPIDLDIGADVRGDEEPTGTEEVGAVDPQTMTEVGTKLDLARAYIDMGDPEGARSILEEVLGEGDPGQRREAQTLIDALPA